MIGYIRAFCPRATHLIELRIPDLFSVVWRVVTAKMLFLLFFLMVAFALGKGEPPKNNHVAGMEFYDTKQQQGNLWKALKYWAKEGSVKNSMNCKACIVSFAALDESRNRN